MDIGPQHGPNFSTHNCNYFDDPKVNISFRLTLRFYDHIADVQTNDSGISLGLTFCLMLISKS